MWTNFFTNAKLELDIICLQITEEEAATADLGVVVSFGDSYAEVVGCCFLTIEGKAVAAMRFGYKGDFGSKQVVLAIPVDGPEVEDMLNVFDAVDVSVDVDITIEGVDGGEGFSIL